MADKKTEAAARAAITKSAKKSGGLLPGALGNIANSKANDAIKRAILKAKGKK